MKLLFFLFISLQTFFTNPILYSDYSDPDVIKVGEDFWMTASSFNCVPGLPILHSKDLVQWELVNAALPRLYQTEEGSEKYTALFDRPAHGMGVWAPSIRYHNEMFYIFWGDPDIGIFYITAKDPCKQWSKPQLIIEGKGLIDPCPLWDDDGRFYLVHGWAGSRAGFKSILTVSELDPLSMTMISENVMVLNGKQTENPTVEGPKFYKRHGWYYIFAPAGGVKEGWQLVGRSRDVYGPYEWKTVLHQGNSDIHGPHQGGWVEDASGESWFLHFEDRYAYGRVLHLQPMRWLSDDWCTIGEDTNGDGIGEPVSKYKSPSAFPTDKSQHDGSRNRAEIPLPWQWHANPQQGWCMIDLSRDLLHLNCIKQSDDWSNFWDTPNLLLEKITGPEMTFTASMSFYPSYDGDRAGVIVMGEDYASIGFEYHDHNIFLTQNICLGADKHNAEEEVARLKITCDNIFIRVKISQGALCTFQYSFDGKKFNTFGKQFTAKAGRWIGAKIGYYATAQIQKNDGGYVEITNQ